ncbi:MAG: hypothetical protein IH845_04495 [Nanoarchaeota archaeon]|nr:hypothetical protein [Nanoarchaeota archaeon]
MKKIISIFCLLILFSSVLVFAENHEEKSPEELKEAIKNNLEKRDILKEKANLPAPLQITSKYLLRTNEDAIWQDIFINLGLFLAFFILMLSVLELFPIMNEGFQKILGSLIITSLVSITGGLSKSAELLLSIAGFFEVVNKYPALKIVITFILAALVIFIFNIVAKWVIRTRKLTKAKVTGDYIREGSKMGELLSKMRNKLSSRNIN